MLRGQNFSHVPEPCDGSERGRDTGEVCPTMRLSRFGSQESATVTKFTENIPGPRFGAFSRIWLPLFLSTKG